MDTYSVLIVEDDESARRQLAKLVKKEGFAVAEAENGAVGLESFKEHRQDIVITDFSLPKLDGLEMIHKIKRLSPDAQVILVTAFGGDDVAMMALQNGVLDYLKKPIDIDALVVALGRAKENIFLRKRTALFPTLLLAEDEDVTRERLARILEAEGWQVLKAADGEQALQLFRDAKIDIALLDIRMPKKDGLAVLKEMRGVSDDFEAIILSGFGDENSAIEAMRSGAINFIRKPIDIDHLIVSVEKAVERLQLNRALKYRNRELEIQREFIAYINKNKEIVINVGDQLSEQIKEFAGQLLDAIPMTIFVVDREFTILSHNRSVKKIMDGKNPKLNEDFVSKLAQVGGKNIVYDELASRINRVFEERSGAVERVRFGQFGYITLSLIKVNLLLQEKMSDFLVVAIRGERS